VVVAVVVTAVVDSVVVAVIVSVEVMVDVVVVDVEVMGVVVDFVPQDASSIEATSSTLKQSQMILFFTL
jgi:hypothetical protein